MKSSRYSSFVLYFILFVMVGCGRWVPGYIITDEGEVISNNDTNMRSTTINSMRSQLDQQLGAHWRTDITIAELPVYDANDRTLETGWTWPKATVVITVIGDGNGEALITNEEITKAVRDFMYHKVDRPHVNLVVTTTSVVDAERFKPVLHVDKTTTVKTNESRHYTVQNNDTYADLSLAFYGSTKHWRLIATANNSAELKPGMDIIIPPKP